MPKRIKYGVGAVAVLGTIGVISFVLIQWVYPPPVADSTAPQITNFAEVFQGVTYQRQTRSIPRPLVIHSVEIDLHASGIDFLVTPGEPAGEREIRARTTSDFLQTFGLQIAINGSFFEPFRVGRFWWQYYPKQGDPVDISGVAISNGARYSEDDKHNRPILCIMPQAAEISSATCPANTTQALAGNPLLVEHGKVVVKKKRETPHPRTAVALNAAGTIMWLIVVDGRQHGISEGVTLVELAQIALESGADTALNLDGGGSSTLVMVIQNEVRLVNTPIHRRIPRFERPVGNHLGVYALRHDEKPGT
jgi:hypothetical protein